jgi:hypothetical protein
VFPIPPGVCESVHTSGYNHWNYQPNDDGNPKEDRAKDEIAKENEVKEDEVGG